MGSVAWQMGDVRWRLTKTEQIIFGCKRRNKKMRGWLCTVVQRKQGFASVPLSAQSASLQVFVLRAPTQQTLFSFCRVCCLQQNHSPSHCTYSIIHLTQEENINQRARPPRHHTAHTTMSDTERGNDDDLSLPKGILLSRTIIATPHSHLVWMN